MDFPLVSVAELRPRPIAVNTGNSGRWLRLCEGWSWFGSKRAGTLSARNETRGRPKPARPGNHPGPAPPGAGTHAARGTGSAGGGRRLGRVLVDRRTRALTAAAAKSERDLCAAVVRLLGGARAARVASADRGRGARAIGGGLAHGCRRVRCAARSTDSVRSFLRCAVGS